MSLEKNSSATLLLKMLQSYETK